MHCLVVKAHPLAESLCASLTTHVVEALERAGHTVQVEDLYARGFTPALTIEERRSYFDDYERQLVNAEIERLLAAEAIVLLFPTWWFSFPAILKGWFDRVWAPGVAYDHADDYGPIMPRLHRLRHMLVVTSLGSPWWVDKLVLWQPVKRVLKTAIVRTCAPNCRLKVLSLYKSERLTTDQVSRFKTRIDEALRHWPNPN
ncbi:NAD(P)H-dependent oxidoreductase [Billgrantia kenyensis]|uniref:NAD(P)H-dependent oxidoreductase n=1 Tax=Billgrantia kenyensis TaxID=321266 RepID=A0A7V9W3Q3_9GAMM|nr:NAD(P)H-dependent oxidoreductase [Halomonas kenyensis]MBA2780395.1 NAD(P)H-dependent oxidoreductase [Halomonas kenyensis]MCG6663397.1 NAD(P)H-dependent oxidoreductase [Halomonas kenyensis]